MKKILSIAFLSLCVLGGFGASLNTFAALGPYAVKIEQRNAANDGDLVTFLTPPSDGASAFIGVTGTPPVAQYWYPSSEFIFSGSALTVDSIAKSKVGLGSVENTALSTWSGSSNITTVGTITGGTWSGGTISLANGGTGATSASSALLALLPSQSGNSGKVLTTDGSASTWQTPTSAPARSQSSASRSLNTCFQVSSTRDVLANYSVEIAATLSLTGGTVGNAFLEIFTDSGCTTGTQELSRMTNGNTGTLTVGLNTVQTAAGNLTGYIPAGGYVKIRTTSTTGTATFNYRSGQEVQV
jgi:hypothetical protein